MAARCTVVGEGGRLAAAAGPRAPAARRGPRVAVARASTPRPRDGDGRGGVGGVFSRVSGLVVVLEGSLVAVGGWWRVGLGDPPTCT